MQSFGEHFGPQLKCLHFRDDARELRVDINLINMCPKLQELGSLPYQSYDMDGNEIIRYTHLNPKINLNKLCLIVKRMDDLLFGDIRQLAPNLTHLELNLAYVHTLLLTSTDDISPMPNLNVFKIKTWTDIQ